MFRSIPQFSSISDRVFAANPVWDRFRAASFEIDHGVFEIAVRAKLAVGLSKNLEVHFYTGAEEVFHPSTDQEMVSQTKGPLVFDMGRLHKPAKPSLGKLLHWHFI